MSESGLFTVPENPHLVPFDESFRVDQAPTGMPPDGPHKDERKKRLERAVTRLDDYQRVLFADNRYSLLLVFQAMDAAGKDGTIRAVMSGVNPAGCQVHSFKQPGNEELDHDFLWRTTRKLPERGRIGIFNRSYYEEVLIVRVHPGYLKGQRLPRVPDLDALWEGRFASIRDHEQHLARNGTIILKFWLNVSRAEQRRRFLDRIDEPDKNWKFAIGDVKERAYWDEYMAAYEAALNATSRPWAPWLAVPADSKSYMRMVVAEAIVDTLASLDLSYPAIEDGVRERFAELRSMLEGDRD